MKHTREQKRAKLLAEAQAVIEEFLDWEEQAAQPKLTEIEDEVLALRERFGQRLAEVALADQDAKQPVAAGDLVLAPKLVAAQFDGRGEAAVRTQFAGRDLEIVYHNPARLAYGAYAIRRVTVDGSEAPVTRQGPAVRIARAVIGGLEPAGVHRVDVELA